MTRVTVVRTNYLKAAVKGKGSWGGIWDNKSDAYSVANARIAEAKGKGIKCRIL
jgi:hypothetical protein